LKDIQRAIQDKTLGFKLFGDSNKNSYNWLFPMVDLGLQRTLRFVEISRKCWFFSRERDVEGDNHLYIRGYTLICDSWRVISLCKKNDPIMQLCLKKHSMFWR
jgi:hypothetical protein